MSIGTNEVSFLERYNSLEVFAKNITLENFGVLEKIGEGAFSKVYKGNIIKDVGITMPNVVAVKIMEKQYLEKMNVTGMALHEAKLLSLFSNIFIIKYYASFSSHDHEHIILDYIQLNLFSIIRSKLYLGESSARLLGSQVLLGLEYLHNFNIAYRDLKPENILVKSNGNIKITDMSFAKYIPGRSYTSMGTVEYMAPEVILGEGHGVAVDWWAFGVLLYEMCSGHSPFNDSYTLRLMKNIIKARFKFPLHFSDELKDLIKQLLVAEVSQRLGNMKGKSNDIKVHAWFNEDVEWTDLEVGNYNLPQELSDIIYVTKF